MFKGNNYKLIFNNTFYRTSKKFVSSKRHHTRFDIMVDWMTSFAGHRSLSLARCFAMLNVGLFLYVNFRPTGEGRFNALHSLSHSLHNQQFKEYVNLFTSQMGARRIDDMLLETGILWTLGHYLEKLHGRPFMMKMFLFSFYIGFLNSLFWVRRDAAKRERYAAEHPTGMRYIKANVEDHKYMSQHGLAMSLAYFFLFKHSFKYLILPVMLVDLAIWGPYYSTGMLTGLAAGMMF
jgi:hypothetical protein